ncbi:unnamed protein product [Brachionus calyciflorus]|uniref:Letm1 RBD domain-containing protein n=1 Tax=Brachionus calyciflorus TaxID=104777 RepID=A0A813VHE6_9BILA|nr:unnamed protein product [Brachionus calyciflorus]
MFYNQILARNYRNLSKQSILIQTLRTSSSKNNKILDLKLIENDQFKTPYQLSNFHTQTQVLFKDPESKAEKTANMIKENILPIKERQIDESAQSRPILETGTISTSQATSQIDVKRPTLWQRIVKELKHYYDGFKLLYFETKIAWGLMKKVLRGETLTRRERRQFTRTSADLFRLVPFSVFIIVPFLEFTLPIFLKLFPNMLPSTFKEQSVEQENLRKQLKVKLEVAKFLQDTLEETALKRDSKNHENSLNQNFADFMKKIRTKGEQPSNEEILKYSSLFENELTLDNLSRQQLIALCQILDVSTLANIPPNHILRFQLRLKIRNLEADDRMILKEGVDALTIDELQQCCRDRGMRAIGLSETRLRNQLNQWLDLHLNRKIPLSLLILSRALYLPDNLPPEDLIKNTISALPKSIENATIAKIAEVTGEKIDNKIKLELLKQEQDEIKKETAISIESQPDSFEKQAQKEKLIDKATVLEGEISPVEIKEINQIIENMPVNEKKQARAEIAELKKDVDEYKEDVKEVQQMAVKLKETKSAKILGQRVGKLISDLDALMAKIDNEAVTNTQHYKNTVSIYELVETIKRIKGDITEAQEKKIYEILKSLDQDKDGKLDDINDVLKVFDLIEQENVKVNKDQLGKLLNLLEKEKLIEIEEEKNKKI